MTNQIKSDFQGALLPLPKLEINDTKSCLEKGLIACRRFDYIFAFILVFPGYFVSYYMRLVELFSFDCTLYTPNIQSDFHIWIIWCNVLFKSEIWTGCKDFSFFVLYWKWGFKKQRDEIKNETTKTNLEAVEAGWEPLRSGEVCWRNSLGLCWVVGLGLEGVVVGERPERMGLVGRPIWTESLRMTEYSASTSTQT